MFIGELDEISSIGEDSSVGPDSNRLSYFCRVDEYTVFIQAKQILSSEGKLLSSHNLYCSIRNYSTCMDEIGLCS